MNPNDAFKIGMMLGLKIFEQVSKDGRFTDKEKEEYLRRLAQNLLITAMSMFKEAKTRYDQLTSKDFE